MFSVVLEYLYLANIIITVLAVISIILANKQSESSIAWILLVLVVPIVGIALYILIGIDWRQHKLVPQLPEDFFEEHLNTVIRQQKDYIREADVGDNEVLQDIVKNMNLLLNSSQAALTLDNQVRFYHDGQALFDSLLSDLKTARESIHMEYFIWKSDQLGEEIKEILIERAAAGVEVKLIFDGLGSFGRISYRYKRELREAGVEFSYFLDLNRFIARLKINYSNHKKIVVIDGKTAYTGGMNIGDEYITGGRHFPSWRDTHIRLTGGSVSILQAIFLSDWCNCRKEMLIKDNFFPDQGVEIKGVPVQIAVSGPDSRWDSIELLYFNMITNANHEVFIQSPYFIPDLAMLKAMESAALSGIRITLMMTGHPDKRVAWWTAFTYFRPLLRAGVRILHYSEGFLHSKVVIMDRMVSTVGTCNMDIRSFKLNYEVNAVFYGEDTADELIRQFNHDVENCREITEEDLDNLSLPVKLRNSICRIFSPLM